MTMRDRLSRVLLIAAAAAAVLIPSVAVADETSLVYALTAWTTEAGLPEQAGSVIAIAQDRDGYLWLGTSRGLIRFDGSEFFPWGAHGEPPLRGNAVRALAAARDGSLWLAYGDVPGVSRIREGNLVHYSEGEGLRSGVIQALIEDRRGTIWTAGHHGLVKFQDEVWQFVGPDQGVPNGQVFSVYEDRAGRIWAGTSFGVVSTTADGPSFTMVDPKATFIQGFVEDSSGTLWVTDTQQLLKPLLSGPKVVYSRGIRLPVAGWRLLSDSTGVIWVAALGAGLLRVRDGGTPATAVVDTFSDSRITGSVQTLFRDRENNVWIGMRGGLLRLRESFVVNDTQLDGLMNEGVRGLTAANDGSVWVGTTYAVNRFAAAGRQVFKFEQTQALHTDRTGTVWLVTLQGIYRFDDDRFTTVSLPHGLRLEGISSLTSTVAGDVWLCDRRAGVVRWQQKELNRFEEVPHVAHRPCAVSYADRQGRVWVGFSTGGVAAYQNGRFEEYGDGEGVPDGNVTAIVEDRNGAIWVATTEGIGRFESGRFTTMTRVNGLPERISSLVEDEDGFLWAAAARGLVRFNPREIERLVNDPSYQVEYTLYDRSDGLPSALSSQSRPSSIRSRDGVLWFATAGGISLVDPRRLLNIRSPTSSRIEQVLLNGHRAAKSTEGYRAPHGSTVEIAYSALSLSAASKLRFRYKLDGLEPEWNYVGERREAVFANLPAGDYRFRVGATHDGVWRDPEGVFAFTVPPPFYQTSLFFGLCATSALLALCGYWLVRLRTVRARHVLVLAERARVSRDIHDTLLQSLTAVGLELEVVARVVSSSDPAATQTVRDCQHRVAECIREARQSVWDLRSPILERRDLASAVREMAAHAVPGGTPRIDVNILGEPLAFSRQAEEELLRIAREAIANAVRHGKPCHVAVLLRYEQQSATLRVADDGCGFNPSDVPHNGEHCGLRNMRDRAAALKGTLNVESIPGGGTVVEATIPIGPR
jgi:ligand-binding sensor domain-containing protein/two-component sensor histidine kinase